MITNSLELKVSDARILEAEGANIEPGSPTANLVVHVQFHNRGEEIQAASRNGIELSLYNSKREKVYVLTDDRNRNDMDAMPLQPGESVDYEIPCGISSGFVKSDETYHLEGEYAGETAETDFKFTRKPR